MSTSYEGREKKNFILTTNVKGDSQKRKILIHLDAKFTSYIELWEELFDLDLYGYRLKFVCKNTLREITCLSEVYKPGQSDFPEVELVVEAPGG